MMLFSTFAARLLLAATLGALVGLERQWRQRSAGLRTNTLVSLGSAAFILLSLSLTDDAGDTSRVAGQIVTGIGFLGAGVIMKTGLNIQGLNTAATIWCSAAVGTLAGSGLYWQAAFTAFVIIVTHIVLRPVGIKLSRMPLQQEELELYIYNLQLKCREQVENHLRVLMLSQIKNEEHLQLRSLRSSNNGNLAYVYIEAQVVATGPHDQELEKIAARLTLEYGVTEVLWEKQTQAQD